MDKIYLHINVPNCTVNTTENSKHDLFVTALPTTFYGLESGTTPKPMLTALIDFLR